MTELNFSDNPQMTLMWLPFVFLFFLVSVMLFVFPLGKKRQWIKIVFIPVGMSLAVLIFSLSITAHNAEVDSNIKNVKAWAETNYDLKLSDNQAESLSATFRKSYVQIDDALTEIQLVKRNDNDYVLLAGGKELPLAND